MCNDIEVKTTDRRVYTVQNLGRDIWLFFWSVLCPVHAGSILWYARTPPEVSWYSLTLCLESLVVSSPENKESG
jgi:hypothetical protein